MAITKNNTRMLDGDIDLTTQITGVLPVANGGTGSSTAVDSIPEAGAVGAYSWGRPLTNSAIAIGDTSSSFYSLQGDL